VDKVARSWEEVYEMANKQSRLNEELVANRGLSYPEREKKKRMIRNLEDKMSREQDLLREIL